MKKSPATPARSPSTRSTVHGLLLFGSLVLYVAILLSKSAGDESVWRWAIPTFVGMWALDAAWNSRTWTGALRWTWTLGFALVFTGDFLTNLSPWSDAALLFFIPAHALFIWQYLLLRPFRRGQLLLLAPVLVVSAAYLVWTLPLIPQTMVAVSLGLYAGLLSVMLWRGLCTALDGGWKGRGRWIAPGATLFYLVDFMVCRGAAEQSDRWSIPTWICYPVALACLGISAWRGPQAAQRPRTVF